MLAFSIDVLGAGRGKIVIGDFDEHFELQLGDWSEADYRLSWRRALEELLADVPAVALMTWSARPGIGLVRRGWTLHRESEIVYIQDRIFLPAGEAFDLDATGHVVHLAPRETASEDGDPISTWTTDICAIGAFLRRH